MGTPELWINTYLDPRTAAVDAAELEASGFDGVSVVDNQAIAPDPFVVLAVAATATTRLGLATGTSNPLTRHPSVLANAAASVAGVSGNRMLLSIGRGLSANFELGLPPSPLSEFTSYLERLAAYARGERVTENDNATSIRWTRAFGSPTFQIEVAATGPKVISTGALVADRIGLAVGADVARLEWAIDTARRARQAAGLDPDGVRFGAYVQAYPHSDSSKAIALARGPVSGLASLSGMAGNTGEGQSDADREQFRRLQAVYDKRQHVLNRSPQAAALDEDFIERFAAVGSAAEVVDRLRAVLKTGVDRLYLSFPAPDADPEDAAESRRILIHEVMPALRAGSGPGAR